MKKITKMERHLEFMKTYLPNLFEKSKNIEKKLLLKLTKFSPKLTKLQKNADNIYYKYLELIPKNISNKQYKIAYNHLCNCCNLNDIMKTRKSIKKNLNIMNQLTIKLNKKYLKLTNIYKTKKFKFRDYKNFEDFVKSLELAYFEIKDYPYFKFSYTDLLTFIPAIKKELIQLLKI